MEFECLAKSLPRSGDSDPHLASFLERRIFDSTHETGRRSVCSAATWLSFPAGFPERLGNNLVNVSTNCLRSRTLRMENKTDISSGEQDRLCSAEPESGPVGLPPMLGTFCSTPAAPRFVRGAELSRLARPPSSLKNLQRNVPVV